MLSTVSVTGIGPRGWREPLTPASQPTPRSAWSWGCSHATPARNPSPSLTKTATSLRVHGPQIGGQQSRRSHRRDPRQRRRGLDRGGPARRESLQGHSHQAPGQARYPRLAEVYGPSAQPVDHNDLWGLYPNYQAYDDRLWFTATANGIHYFEVRAVRGSGDYFVAIIDVDLGENRSTKGRITVDGKAQSRVNYNGDIDWFRVSLSANTAYRIELRARPPATAPCTTAC